MVFGKALFLTTLLSACFALTVNEIGYKEYKKEIAAVSKIHKKVHTGYIKKDIFYPDELGGVLLEKGDEVQLIKIGFEGGMYSAANKKRKFVREDSYLTVNINKFTEYEAGLPADLVYFPYRNIDITRIKEIKNPFLRISSELYYEISNKENPNRKRLETIGFHDMGRGYSDFTNYLLSMLYLPGNDKQKVLETISSIGDSNVIPELVKFAHIDKGSQNLIANHLKNFELAQNYLIYMSKEHPQDIFYTWLLADVGGFKAIDFFLEKYLTDPNTSIMHIKRAAQTPEENQVVYRFIKKYVSSSKLGCSELKPHIRNLEEFGERIKIKSHQIVHPCK